MGLLVTPAELPRWPTRWHPLAKTPGAAVVVFVESDIPAQIHSPTRQVLVAQDLFQFSPATLSGTPTGISGDLRDTSKLELMFIAHAPSGYILSVLTLSKARVVPASAVAVICAGVLGALAPDFDMFYFYLFDNRQTHHHKYFSHWPIIWLGLSLSSWLIYSRRKKSALAFLAFIFSGCGFLHIVLDSFVGDIWWFAPFIDQPFALFTVPARFKPWWLNFILHWSFAVELMICLWAFALYRRRSNPALQGTLRDKAAQRP